jgi:hypothetical protein
MLTARERAEIGAVYLDEVAGPEWFEEVNVETLDISSGCNCVAAQVAGPEEGPFANAWERAMYEWGIVTGTQAGDELTTTDCDKAKRLGFLGENAADDDDLCAAWVEIIAERVKARVTT